MRVLLLAITVALATVASGACGDDDVTPLRDASALVDSPAPPIDATEGVDAGSGPPRDDGGPSPSDAGSGDRCGSETCGAGFFCCRSLCCLEGEPTMACSCTL